MKSTLCTPIIHHLNRIQGQIDALKSAIDSGNDCTKIARLSRSIERSFLSVRTKITEGSLICDVFDGKLSAKKQQDLKEILDLFGGK